MTERVNNRIWIARGGWALADQACFVVANVLLNVLLARWLKPAEYGAFAVAYSIFLLLGAFHTALITEPMLVFGAGRYANQVHAYLRTLLRGHWYLTSIGSAVLLVAALLLHFLHPGALSQALLALALATPFSLLTWFGRRAAYLTSRPRAAAIASAIYLLSIFTGLIALASFNILSLFSALAVVGVAGALAGFLLLHQIHLFSRAAFRRTEQKVIWDAQLNYGRWAIATQLLMWVPLNLFFVVLSILVNFEASATLKAFSNLVLPLLQANAALATLLLPALAARVNDTERFNKLLGRSLAVFVSLACLYSLLLAGFGGPLVNLLYGGTYDSQVQLLWLLLLIPICDAVMVVLSSAARSLERPDRVFWSQLAVALFVLPIGIIATRSFGLTGAAAAIVAGSFIGVLVLVFTQVWSSSFRFLWQKSSSTPMAESTSSAR